MASLRYYSLRLFFWKNQNKTKRLPHSTFDAWMTFNLDTV